MSNLLAALRSSATTMTAFDKVLEVTQNNVTNANTPGYVRQRLLLQAMPFDMVSGSPGGVTAGDVQSSRDEYAEQAVRQQTSLLGQAMQSAASLSAISGLFDVTGASGIPKALNNLLQSFSSWAQTPDNQTVRQTVIDRAAETASAFQQTAGALENARDDTENELTDTTNRINDLVGQLRDLNKQIFQGARNDAGIDSQLHSKLEDLSQYLDFTARQEADGSVTILMNGQTPLLIGDRQYQISYQLEKPAGDSLPYPDAAAQAVIRSADGVDLTAQTTGGKLGALLQVRNQVLPSFLGNAYQAGDLNLMAQQFAKTVNRLLESGYVSDDGVNPQPGIALFQYSTDDTQTAKTLSVDPAIGGEDLAAISPGPPYISNGIPLALSALSDAKGMDGTTFAAYFGHIAAGAGNLQNRADEQVQAQQSLLAQAKDLRHQLSGVSLDEEATILIQFQRAYEANSKLIQILDHLTDVAINILQR
jgi:flagellar hook-associated protein 1 FlgK